MYTDEFKELKVTFFYKSKWKARVHKLMQAQIDIYQAAVSQAIQEQREFKIASLHHELE